MIDTTKVFPMIQAAATAVKTVGTPLASAIAGTVAIVVTGIIRAIIRRRSAKNPDNVSKN